MGVFIDADNLNDATALDHVFATLHDRGDHVLYKRAYGRTESLRAIEPVLWRHGVRPVANMLVNKVTTDSAQVIDAVEAVCSGAINAFALCSGDADFVPLATWAREKGCQVLCFSLSDRIFANPENFYDDVVLLEVVDPTIVQDEASSAIAAAARTAPQAENSVDVLVPGSALGEKTFACDGIASPIDQVLAAFPALHTGQPQNLSQVVAVLRQRGILAKTTKTTVWFSRWPSVFELTPLPVAHQVTYRKTVQQVAQLTPCAAPVVSTAGPPPLHLSALKTSNAQIATLPLEVQRILQAVPALRHGPQMLNRVVPMLRQQGLLGRGEKSTSLLARYPDIFLLSPAGQPTQVHCLVPLNGKLQPHQLHQHKATPSEPCSCSAHQSGARVLAWHVAAARQPTLPLPCALNRLRHALGQLALQRIGTADVLRAAPELLLGQPCTVAAVAGRLRERGLLRPDQSVLTLLHRHTAAFCLHTDHLPHTVCYLVNAKG